MMDWGHGNIAEAIDHDREHGYDYIPKQRVVQIFANPFAGSFSQALLREHIERLETEEAEIIVSLDHPYRLAGDHVTEIIIIGGDGTIRDVLRCMSAIDADTLVTIVPAGTVNLLFRELSDGQCGEKGQVHSVYPARGNDQAMLVCASGGPDAHIVAHISKKLKRWIGRGAYVVSALRQLVFWQNDEFLLDHNGKQTVCAAFYVAKGKYYAGPWSFAPAADATKASFHVVALPDPGRLAYLKFVVALLSGRMDRQKSLMRFSCKNLAISSLSGESPIQIDGDSAGYCPIDLSIAPQAVRIRV